MFVHVPLIVRRADQCHPTHKHKEVYQERIRRESRTFDLPSIRPLVNHTLFCAFSLVFVASSLLASYPTSARKHGVKQCGPDSSRGEQDAPTPAKEGLCYCAPFMSIPASVTPRPSCAWNSPRPPSAAYPYENQTSDGAGLFLEPSSHFSAVCIAIA